MGAETPEPVEISKEEQKRQQDFIRWTQKNNILETLMASFGIEPGSTDIG